MTRLAPEMPSRATLKWLGAISLLLSLACFSVLSADYNCGAQSWDCASFAGIAVVALMAGLALGLPLTALVVVLGWCFVAVRPLTRAPEPKARAARVALTLVLLHLLAFAALEIVGVLPVGWLWWLGAFGGVGMHPSGATYVIVPSN